MNNPNPRDEVELPPSCGSALTLDNETLLDVLLQSYARSGLSNSRIQHDRWVECKAEMLQRLTRAAPPTPVSTTPETELDVMCPHGWARDVACDECGRSGFRWIGINAEGGNKLTPIEITGVWLTRKGSENDPKARVEVHVELPDGWHHVITEPLGANFSHAVSPSGIRQSPLSEWANPASPLTVPACVLCGHRRWLSDNEAGICQHIVDDPTVCGCKCEFPTAQGEAEVRTAPIGPIAGGASHEPTCGVWRGSSCDCVTRINNLAQEAAEVPPTPVEDERLKEIQKDLERGARPWYDTDIRYLLTRLSQAEARMRETQRALNTLTTSELLAQESVRRETWGEARKRVQGTWNQRWHSQLTTPPEVELVKIIIADLEAAAAEGSE